MEQQIKNHKYVRVQSAYAEQFGEIDKNMNTNHDRAKNDAKNAISSLLEQLDNTSNFQNHLP